MSLSDEELAEQWARELETVREPKRRAEILFALATLLLEKFEDVDGSIPIFVEALFEQPGNEAIARAIEAVAGPRERFGQVLELLNACVDHRALLDRPDDRVALLLRAGKWYGDAGHPEWGAAYVEKARNLAPADPRVAKAWERLVSLSGPMEAVEAARRRVLELDPKDLDALEGLERVMRARGALDELVAFLEGLVRGSVFGRLNPARIKLASVLEELGQPERAIAILEEGFAADRTDRDLLRALDRAYEKQGRWADLLRTLEARLSHDPYVDRVEITLRIAKLLDEQFLDPSRADARLSELLAVEPDAVDAYVALARVQMKMRRFDEALATLDWEISVIEDPVARAEACAMKARIFLDELGDPLRAIEALEAGRKLDSENDLIPELLVRAYEKAGDVARSLAAMVTVAFRKHDADGLVTAGTSYRTRLSDARTARRLYRQALEHDPTHLGALEALRTLAMEHGSYDEAATYLDRMARHTQAPATCAKLLVELGVLRREKLGDEKGALHAFEQALAIEPTNTRAAAAVAEAHLDAARFDDANEVLSRLASVSLKPEDQRVVLPLVVRVSSERGEHARAFEAARRAVRLGATSALPALVDAAMQIGEVVEALAAQKRLLSLLPADDHEARIDAKLRLAEIRAASGDRRGAAKELEDVLEVDNTNDRALRGLLAIAVELRAWDYVAGWEAQLLDIVTDVEERRALLRVSADRWAREAKDLPRAIASLEGLLALDPTDRSVLHEILAHHQTLRSFADVSRTIERIVALDPDPRRRAKYLIAAAKVHRDELDDPAGAVERFDRALDEDPHALEAFRALEAVLTRAKDFKRLERAYRKMIHRARPLGDANLEFTLWHALGLIYRDRLGDAAAAVEAFRMASQLRPGDETEHRIVAEIYESVDRTDLAVAELQAAIERDPMTVAHHRALHAIHLRRCDRDRAFLTASTLVLLDAADDEARALYEAERPRELLPYGMALAAGNWKEVLRHPDLDPGVSSILAAVARGARVAKARASTLPRGSLPPKQREDAGAPRHAAAQILFRVAQVLGLEPPELYVRPDLPGALAAVAREDKTLVMGSSLLEGWSPPELAFIAGKHLVALEGEHGVRALFPSKSELRAILLGAISLGLGAVSPSTGSTTPEEVSSVARALEAVLGLDERRALHAAVARFAASSGRADVERWMQCSELTGLRAALLVSGDLPVAARLVRLEPAVAGDLAPAEKIRDLVRFAVSERHCELRRLLRIDVQAPASATRARAAEAAA